VRHTLGMTTSDPRFPGEKPDASNRPKSFRQVTRPPLRAYVLGALLVVVAGALAILAVPIDSPASAAWLALAFPLFAVGALVLLSSIRFAFDESAVQIALVPLYRTHIPLDEVADADVVEYLRVSEARGRGVRRRTDRGRTLLYDSGPAIRLTTTDGRRFVVRSRYPGEAVRALTEALR
jgi:hypothetical protein